MIALCYYSHCKSSVNPTYCDFVRLHQFEWHGPDRSDPAHWTPKGNQFTELAHVPNHFYYNVCLSVSLLCDCVYGCCCR